MREKDGPVVWLFLLCTVYIENIYETIRNALIFTQIVAVKWLSDIAL